MILKGSDLTAVRGPELDFARTIRADIKKGHLEKGRVYTQGWLETHYGVGHSLMRAECKKLRTEGLIDIRRHVGVWVKAPDNPFFGVTYHALETVRSRITDGTYPAGESLRNVTDLRQELTLSCRRWEWVVGELVRQGLVIKGGRKGAGPVVVGPRHTGEPVSSG